MRLNKSKEDVLNQINSAAMNAVSCQLNSNLNMKVDMGSVAYAFQSAIAQAITESFRVLIESQYTDDDFERDITLKP